MSIFYDEDISKNIAAVADNIRTKPGSPVVVSVNEEKEEVILICPQCSGIGETHQFGYDSKCYVCSGEKILTISNKKDVK